MCCAQGPYPLLDRYGLEMGARQIALIAYQKLTRDILPVQARQVWNDLLLDGNRRKRSGLYKRRGSGGGRRDKDERGKQANRKEDSANYLPNGACTRQQPSVRLGERKLVDDSGKHSLRRMAFN